MENKNTIKTFCGWKPEKKKKKKKMEFSLIKTLLVLIKKRLKALNELQDTDNIQR